MNSLFKDQVPLMRPWLGEEEIEAVAEVMRSGWISQGPKVIEFEEMVADFVGAKYAVATNACTSSMHLALRTSGIKRGDDVIVPDFTCMATANAIHHTGATPIFAEIDRDTYNITAETLEAAITENTRAVMAVHQIGLPIDMDPLMDVANKHGIKVIEDAATAFGAEYKGKRLGGLGRPSCFSFHPRKMITTAEGGMITTDDEGMVKEAKALRATGASISDLERHKAKGVLVQEYHDFGYNYRMTDMQAAIGIVQMARADEIIQARADQAAYYDAAFASVPEVVPPYVPSNMKHAYSSYKIRLDNGGAVDRDTVLRRMAERGISCRTAIQPLHWEPYYQKDWAGVSFPITEELAKTTMFLPIFPGMTQAEQDRVIESLVASLKQ